MSSAGTVNGRGFVISYSVQSNISTNNNATGGYTVTIDNDNVAYVKETAPGGMSAIPSSANGSHLFFTSKIALAFTQGFYNSSYYATGSGSMKYILGT